MFKNGDKVTYQRCFGDRELIFVGMAESLDYKNDCVVIHTGNAVPATLSGLEKINEVSAIGEEDDIDLDFICQYCGQDGCNCDTL